MYRTSPKAPLPIKLSGSKSSRRNRSSFIFEATGLTENKSRHVLVERAEKPFTFSRLTFLSYHAQ